MRELGSADFRQTLDGFLKMATILDRRGYMEIIAYRSRVLRDWLAFLELYPVILTPLSVKRTPEANADLGGDARVHSLFWNDLRFMSSINVLGLPAAVVPIGLVAGNPVGVQLIGSRYREDVCLDAAATIESRIIATRFGSVQWETSSDASGSRGRSTDPPISPADQAGPKGSRDIAAMGAAAVMAIALSKPIKGARICSRKRRDFGECRLSSSARAAKLASGKSLAGGDGMAMQLGHVHIKTREDPQKVAKFYIDNFGATVKREIPGRGCQLDLHGVQLNVTTIIADQNHEQHVGIEHIAIETDDYAGALANFKKNDAKILEERVNNGRHVCWVAAPDGAQMELIEKV